MGRWPATAEELVEKQTALAELAPTSWEWTPTAAVGGCFVCFERGPSGRGRAGDRAWAAAAVADETVAIGGAAAAPYEAGLLALRDGALLEAAVHALSRRPDVLLVDATGRDHPRRAGLALQLGKILGLPTVGVTHRTLLPGGDWPPEEQRATSPLTLTGEVVGYWLRTIRGKRPSPSTPPGAHIRTPPSRWSSHAHGVCERRSHSDEPVPLLAPRARLMGPSATTIGPQARSTETLRKREAARDGELPNSLLSQIPLAKPS